MSGNGKPWDADTKKHFRRGRFSWCPLNHTTANIYVLYRQVKELFNLTYMRNENMNDAELLFLLTGVPKNPQVYDTLLEEL